MKNLIKYPVRYETMGTMIMDSEQNLVCDVRGWGRISYMENPEEKQDSVGNFIADAINEKFENCGANLRPFTLKDSKPK